MRRQIRKDKSGQFSTDKGWKIHGEKRVQHRFYLGRHVHEAKRREQNLAWWWGCTVLDSFKYVRSLVAPCWEPWSMMIAKQLAKGVSRDFDLPSMPDWFVASGGPFIDSSETDYESHWLSFLNRQLADFDTIPIQKTRKPTFKELRMTDLSDHFNVSQWIRDFKQANPNATHTDIIKAGEKVTLDVHTCASQLRISLRLDYVKVGNALKALKKGAACPSCGRIVATKRGKFLPHKTSPLPRQSDPLCEGSRTLVPIECEKRSG